MYSPEVQNLIKLVGVSVVLIATAGYFSYKSYMERYPDSNINEWFNGKTFSTNTILIGMVSGLIFGFIDNAGLWIGMEYLDPFTKQFGELTQAGIGNTFSDALGVTMGTFIGSIITNKTKVEQTPIWADAVGIIVGCLLGIFICRMFSTKK